MSDIHQSKSGAGILPEGWSVERCEQGEIRVVAPSGNMSHVSNAGSLQQRLLYELVDGMLAHVGVVTRLNTEILAELARVESVLQYSLATLSPGNERRRDGEWVEVHASRAGSSYRQMEGALKAVARIRRHLDVAGSVVARGG